MSTLESHYTLPDMTTIVLGALADAGHDVDRLSPATLTPLEDFHTGGRRATAQLAALADVGPGLRVLDVGCGIGGPARYLAEQGCSVVGVDLTPAFIDLARALNERTGLGDRIELHVADAAAVPFGEEEFDVVWTQHAAMNIADKPALYREARRVLRPGGRLALFDVVMGDGRPIHLPVPWASAPEHSFLVSSAELQQLLDEAGFQVTAWEDATDQLRDALPVSSDASATGPALTPALYVPDAKARFAAYRRNLAEGRTGVVYGIAIAV